MLAQALLEPAKRMAIEVTSTNSPILDLSEPSRVPSVERALDLLELLASQSQGLTLSEISRHLGIPKSSAHYLVGALGRRGYLYRSACGHDYSIGLRLANLTNVALAEGQLKAITTPYLQELIEKLGLSTQVAVRDGFEAITVCCLGSTAVERPRSWVGRHIDLHSTAVGKALIAYSPDKEIHSLLERGLRRHNANTICSQRALFAHLAEVRIRGYSTDLEEDQLGVRCVGTPIYGNLGRAIAAVSISSAASNLPDRRIPSLASELISVAREISRDLVYIPPVMLQNACKPQTQAAPDNWRSGLKQPCYYEPELNRRGGQT